MNIVEVQDLTTGYSSKNGDKVIGQYPSLQLEKGDFVALIGKNGVGKSTLLKTLSGDISPLKGEVKILNKKVDELSSLDKSKQISFVLSQVHFTGKLSVKDVVTLGRYPYVNWWGKLSKSDNDIVLQALEDVGAIDFIDRDVNTLSDGERQKVMIARAIAQDTSLILLDESTAHLDLINRIEIFQLLKKIARTRNKAILLSTHEVEMSLQVADKLWILSENKCIVGTPDMIISKNDIGNVFNTETVGFDTQNGVFNFCATHKSFSFGIELEPSINDYNGDLNIENRVLWLKRKFQSEGCFLTNETPEIKISLSYKNDILEWEIEGFGKVIKIHDHNKTDLYKEVVSNFII
ncbi:ABC transporter ATP-binding protein [Flammeovirga agarivorans]|uniref:ABC transporter ATP-binding protein n=1 Tax=Flammeovirga agarivorans TaxID=2726742 RepID=A0A7X8XWJ1_9BACT|nr:ABC transporter ATP-binding protein [Flammeovirga agarivorans]NLR92343.1 ABC transporter ATP-binding protein [Flammeovirga agarivorans]